MKIKTLTCILVLLFFSACKGLTDIEEPEDDTDAEYLAKWHSMLAGCLPEVEDRYLYPAVPGSVAWANAAKEGEQYSYAGIFRAMQLPDDVLKNISTPGLLRSISELPYTTVTVSGQWSWTVAFHNFIYPRYNSVQEFINRKDAVETLFQYYDAIKFDCVKPLKEVELMEDYDESMYEMRIRGRFYFAIFAVPGFFTFPKILDQLDYADRQKAVAIMLSKYDRMDATLSTTRLSEIMAHVMYQSNYLPLVEYFQPKIEKNRCPNWDEDYFEGGQDLFNLYQEVYRDLNTLIVHSFAKTFIQ